MDDLTAEQRRKNMKHIRSKDTKAEIVLRKSLWHRGYRYRKNYKELPGHPDIVLTRFRLCIFVDSEFFHGKGFDGDYQSKKYSSLREQLEHGDNPDYWIGKIKRNMQRDIEVDKALHAQNWSVLHFWSKDVLKNAEKCVDAVEEEIFSQKLEDE